MKFATNWHYPPDLRHVDTPPWKIKNSG